MLKYRQSMSTTVGVLGIQENMNFDRQQGDSGSGLNHVSVFGREKQLIMSAYLAGNNLKFRFEHQARDRDEGDSEFIHTVACEEFASIAIMFGVEPRANILEVIQQISDSGRGEKLEDALISNEITNELFTWKSRDNQD